MCIILTLRLIACATCLHAPICLSVLQVPDASSMPAQMHPREACHYLIGVAEVRIPVFPQAIRGDSLNN